MKFVTIQITVTPEEHKFLKRARGRNTWIGWLLYMAKKELSSPCKNMDNMDGCMDSKNTLLGDDESGDRTNKTF